MDALEKIKSAGFNVSLHESGGVYITPASKLTPEYREYIKLHKPEIIRLLSVNDAELKLSNAEISTLLQSACLGVSLEPEQFWSFLDESDIEGIRAGLIPLEVLSAFAKSWARYPDLVPICNHQTYPSEPEPTTVCCKDCNHFTPDPIGSGAGIGKCGKGITQPLLWPGKQRYCDLFED